jgi:hypothetical protein
VQDQRKNTECGLLKTKSIDSEQKKESITTAKISSKTSIYHEINETDLQNMDPSCYLAAEADVFWCLSKLIDEI